MNKKSDAQRERDAIYKPVRLAYLKAHLYCETCIVLSAVGGQGGNSPGRVRPRYATDIHHSRGKLGVLLWDTRYFKAVCRPCHDWIHANRKAATALGLLCENWNSDKTEP